MNEIELNSKFEKLEKEDNIKILFANKNDTQIFFIFIRPLKDYLSIQRYNCDSFRIENKNYDIIGHDILFVFNDILVNRRGKLKNSDYNDVFHSDRIIKDVDNFVYSVRMAFQNCKTEKELEDFLQELFDTLLKETWNEKKEEVKPPPELFAKPKEKNNSDKTITKDVINRLNKIEDIEKRLNDLEDRFDDIENAVSQVI